MCVWVGVMSSKYMCTYTHLRQIDSQELKHTANKGGYYLRHSRICSQSSGNSWNSNGLGIPSVKMGVPLVSKQPASSPPLHSRMYMVPSLSLTVGMLKSTPANQRMTNRHSEHNTCSGNLDYPNTLVPEVGQIIE